MLVDDLEPLSTYAFTVESRDLSGNASVPSDQRTFRTPRPGVADHTSAAFRAGDETGTVRVDDASGDLTLSGASRLAGTFRSRVLDAHAMVTWDRAVWDASIPAGATLQVWARTGSTAEPDGTWTDWKSVTPRTAIGAGSRYLQYELRMTAQDGKRLPSIDSIGFTHTSPPPAHAPSESEATAAAD